MSSWNERLQALRTNALHEIYSSVIAAPLEALLHPSARRLYWLGFFAVMANSVFGLIWSTWLQQPYENLYLRGLLVCLGFIIFFVGARLDLRNRWVLVILGILFWFELPFFSAYMYFANGRNAVWLATLVSAILIYHTITDWRIATLGTCLGLVVGFEVVSGFEINPVQPISDWRVDGLVIAFGWSVGAMLGISAASRQRVQLTQTLASIGIMAHELRTPLSSIGLIANHLERVAVSSQDTNLKKYLVEQVKKIDRLSIQMNRQIDTQIANAKLETLHMHFERVGAYSLISGCLQNYPFKSAKHATCWRIDLESDFEFIGPKELMEQVIFNLLKNALVSLNGAGSEFTLGSIVFRIFRQGSSGHIVVADKGVGMSVVLQRTIFEPFFSTQQGVAHGLGLAFCKKVVGSCNGRIDVTSQLGQGANFRLTFPLGQA
jgi:two-component system CAI-1 autoinducer sensor kinase/phosphatase CqsS